MDCDEFAEIFDTEVGEGHDAIIAEIVDPNQAVFGFHLHGDLPMPLLVRSQLFGDAVNREDMVDLVDLHGQAARALDCGAQFQGISSPILAAE